jgi:signal transduction histidine kinase
VQESVSTAGRLGGAGQVRIDLSDAGVLRIVDDGAGFVVEGAGEGRFGLVSMRERAHRVGAELRVRSTPGAGTSVEVLLP